ncbi:MAG: chemotaxis response regulator protein-glutamate methylesterase [Dehalococcoidales bacterium]|nr:chemotaxis response regulator protein-glutamate methylesterase [Dehalococcoidales bacterium]
MQKKLRVLVVDDSGYVITAVSNKLNADPEIEVIGSARNGIEAVEKVKSLKPDVVTLDVIMPEMDGIAALKIIMEECPTPVVMLSALTSENAETTMKALELGAVDFFLKPSAINPVADDTLAAKIKTAAKCNLIKNGRVKADTGSRKKVISQDKYSAFEKLVVIGASTGGPRSLMQIIPALPADIPAAVLIVQHLPPVFTRSLAERLDQVSQINVVEAEEGSIASRGRILVAPGDFHMLIESGGKIKLDQGPHVLGVRPAADITMKSAAAKFGDAVVGVVLTGMGIDGTQGASYIKAAGGQVLAQDEATSAVYGMPMSVVKAGYADKVLPLHKIADGIVKVCASRERVA